MFYNGQKIETKRLIGFVNTQASLGVDYIYIDFQNKALEDICTIQLYLEESEINNLKKYKCNINTFENQRRKNYMIEALNEALQMIFAENPECIVENYVSLSNFGSKRFHEKFGFSGSHHSTYWAMNKERFENTAQNRKDILREAQKENFFLSEVQENINFEKNFLQSFNL